MDRFRKPTRSRPRVGSASVDKIPAFSSTCRVFWCATLLTLAICTPTWADDIELFIGGSTPTSSNPNVLFVLDDSGSMSNEVPGTNKSRMANMKEALHLILDQVTNVNIGFMDFNDPGGPIRFPVADVDASVADVLGSGTTSFTVNAPIASSTDDAEWNPATATLFLDEEELEISDNPTDIISIAVAASEDDAESCPLSGANPGANFITSTQMEMTTNGTCSRINAVRFVDVDIPAGTGIQDASIEFSSRNGQSNASNLRVTGHLDANSATFMGCGSCGDIEDRRDNSGTSTTVAWNNVPAWSSGERGPNTTTPNLFALVEEIVALPAWDPASNALTFIFDGTGLRNASTYDHGASLAAILSVEYVSVPPKPNTVGLRFEQVLIPQGATITEAYIQFTAANAGVGSPTIGIFGENVDNAETFIDDEPTFEARASTVTGQVNWGPVAPWVAGVRDATTQTADISLTVQNIVNRAGWCGNNGMAFFLAEQSNNAGYNDAISFDGDPANAPELVVKYNFDIDNPPAGASGCVNVVQNYQIGTRKDDVEQAVNGSSYSTGGNSLGMPFEGGNDQTVGLRFTSIQIEAGATILDAYLEFRARRNDSGSISLQITADDTDDSEPFTNGNRPNNRTKTSGATGVVPWPDIESWSQDEFYRTSNLSGLIQYLVNLPGWAVGNDISLFVADLSGDGRRRARSFDDDAFNAPRLVIQVAVIQVASGGASILTVRDKLHQLTDVLNTDGFTPAVGAYIEAARYFRGDEVLWGRTRGLPEFHSSSTIYGLPAGPSSNGIPDHPTDLISVQPINNADAENRIYQATSHVASLVPGTFNLIREPGCSDVSLTVDACRTEHLDNVTAAPPPTYKSPIEDECQGNYILLLTDGDANHNYPHDRLYVQGLPNFGTCAALGRDNGTGNPRGEECGREMATFLFNEDQSSSFDNKQSVKTYTVGFNIPNSARDFLVDLADLGGGDFFEAQTAQQLANVFANIIASIKEDNQLFEAPAVSVNAFNRLTSRDDLFFALFKPTGLVWQGNVKKYQVSGSGNDAVIVDATLQPAVNSATGFFREESCSFWTDCAGRGNDGKEVTAGGMSSRFLGAGRKVYTFSSASAPSNANLTSSVHALHEDNADVSGGSGNLTRAMFGLAASVSDDNFIARIQNARGVDVDNSSPPIETPLEFMGDPLHGQPAAITYSDDGVNPDLALAVVTNQGFFHLIDPQNDAAEWFAFIPQELLPNLESYFTNVAVNGVHPYGLDNDPVVWRKESDDLDETVEPADGDHVYIYLTMRRGGRSVYALDITDRSTPILKWKIQGGLGDEFDELGQTWSKPQLSRIKDASGVETDVLFIGGGYDNVGSAPNNIGGQDTQTVPQFGDSQGRAIFMVNAETGALLWSAGPNASGPGVGSYLQISQMQYSIPADVRVIEIDGDGLVDRLYPVDTGGQILRIDFEDDGLASPAQGGRIAWVQSTDGSHPSAEVDNRRFYEAVDVALLDQCSAVAIPTLSLSVGTGYRAHPLDEDIEERFYVVFDKHIADVVPSANYATEYGINQGNMANLTLITDPALVRAALQAVDGRGWYLDLNFLQGEKILGRSLTFNGALLFTSFTPPQDNGALQDQCQVALGTGRLYVVDICNATGLLEGGSRSVLLERDGIPPSPTVIFTSKGTLGCQEGGVGCGEGDVPFEVEPVFMVGSELLKDVVPEGSLVSREWWREAQ